MATYDCKNQSQSAIYKPPAYHFCWGLRKLPQALSFKAGPTALLAPNTEPCPFWPTTEVFGTMNRGTTDGFYACEPGWMGVVNGFRVVFNYPIRSDIGGVHWPKLSCTINMAEMRGEFGLGVDMPGNLHYSEVTGSCSQDKDGVVTMAYRSVVTNLLDNDMGGCVCPVTVFYQG